MDGGGCEELSASSSDQSKATGELVLELRWGGGEVVEERRRLVLDTEVEETPRSRRRTAAAAAMGKERGVTE